VVNKASCVSGSNSYALLFLFFLCLRKLCFDFNDFFQ